ncbi:hypothetical protein [Acinetobacter gerneri]|uniref:hypothetical protein n=1 Tax=Acinetobacter gerneri TaxID=202952 RepID=UPI0028AA193B|nr:hypothetical protein [Acinetobacter gerneri]
MNTQTHQLINTIEKKEKFDPFKSKFLFFFIGFWLATTGAYYVDVITKYDYSVISAAVIVLTVFACYF